MSDELSSERKEEQGGGASNSPAEGTTPSSRTDEACGEQLAEMVDKPCRRREFLGITAKIIGAAALGMATGQGVNADDPPPKPFPGNPTPTYPNAGTKIIIHTCTPQNKNTCGGLGDGGSNTCTADRRNICVGTDANTCYGNLGGNTCVAGGNECIEASDSNKCGIGNGNKCNGAQGNECRGAAGANYCHGAASPGNGNTCQGGTGSNICREGAAGSNTCGGPVGGGENSNTCWNGRGSNSCGDNGASNKCDPSSRNKCDPTTSNTCTTSDTPTCFEIVSSNALHLSPEASRSARRRDILSLLRLAIS